MSRRILLIVLSYLILLQPLYALLIPATAQADTPTSTVQYSDDPTCQATAAATFDPSAPDPSDPSDFVEQTIDVTSVKSLPADKESIDLITSRAYIDSVISHF